MGGPMNRQALEQRMEAALRRAHGLTDGYPDPGQKRLSPNERQRRARRRFQAIADYHEAAAQLRDLQEEPDEQAPVPRLRREQHQLYPPDNPLGPPLH